MTTLSLGPNLSSSSSVLHSLVFISALAKLLSPSPILFYIFMFLYFCLNLFVVLWETVMGPKPARIKGNVLFYPFSCESKASAEVQHFIFCLSFIVLYCLSLSSLPTLSQFLYMRYADHKKTLDKYGGPKETISIWAPSHNPHIPKLARN